MFVVFFQAFEFSQISPAVMQTTTDRGSVTAFILVLASKYRWREVSEEKEYRRDF